MKVQSLHIYPLKSGRGLSLPTSRLDAFGLAGDRRFMLVDPDGRFITQRELQALAQIVAVVENEELKLVHDGKTIVNVDWQARARRTVEIWGQAVSAARADDASNAALSALFGRQVELVHADAETVRISNPAWAGEGVRTGFSDGYPVLVTTTASLDALVAQSRAEGMQDYGMDRFRPNIVIEQPDAFAEDQWASISIGGIRFDLVKPCPRCIMTTQDQLTGERGAADPMPAMRSLRLSADRRVPGVLFGWNAVARAIGSVSVGDAVEVLERRPDGWAFNASS